MRRHAATVEQHEGIAGAKTTQTNRGNISTGIGARGLALADRHAARLRNAREQLRRSRDATGLNVLIGDNGDRQGFLLLKAFKMMGKKKNGVIP